MPFLANFFGWEGSPAKIDYTEKRVPLQHSNLSAGFGVWGGLGVAGGRGLGGEGGFGGCRG